MVAPAAPVKFRRKDALPENSTYRDDGCEASPHCLACPLEVCRYDVRGGIAGVERRSRNSEIVALRGRGMKIAEIGRKFTLSRRGVFRALAAARAAKK